MDVIGGLIMTNIERVNKLKLQAIKEIENLPQNKMLPCLIYSKIIDYVQEITGFNRQIISSKFGCLTTQETINEIRSL